MWKSIFEVKKALQANIFCIDNNKKEMWKNREYKKKYVKRI